MPGNHRTTTKDFRRSIPTHFPPTPSPNTARFLPKLRVKVVKVSFPGSPPILVLWYQASSHGTISPILALGKGGQASFPRPHGSSGIGRPGLGSLQRHLPFG